MNRLKLIMVLTGMYGLTALAALGNTWLVEAESAGDGSPDQQLPGAPAATLTWKIEKSPDASAGALIGGALRGESHPISIQIPKAGTYRIWVRHLKTEGKISNFSIIFRDDIDEVIDAHRIDWKSPLHTSKPYLDANETAPPTPAGVAPKPAFAWSSVEVTFERSMNASIAFGGMWSSGKMGVDALVITNDLSYNPQKSDWQKLPATDGEAQKLSPPPGLMAALPLTLTTSFFSNIADPKKQFKIDFINNASVYYDFPWLLQLGVNLGSGWSGGSTKYGVGVFTDPCTEYEVPELYKNTPAPTGRFVNSDGSASSRFSYSYEPYRKAVMEQFVTDLAKFKDNDIVEQFRISDENAGRLDYSDASKERFHKSLAEKYGQIAKLNELWGKNYASFDAIPLPKTPDDGIAEWFAFHEFNGMEMVSLIGEKGKLIKQLDPKHRPANSQSSCLSILAPEFTSPGPLDFEKLIDVGFEGQPTFGMDAYSTEDYFAGSDMNLIMSIAKDKVITNNEWNVHTPDPRIAARSYWSMVSMGIKGISTYMLQQNSAHWQSPMWGLLNLDFTPGNKVSALAQANHEIRHIEPLLMGAKPVPFVKPVALYYSRLDLTLPQPLFDLYGTQVDSPYRVYAILRGLGYPVRWVTPKQIEAGELKDIGALIMTDAKYVPQKAAAKIEEWVKAGGSLMGDQWPGIFNEYGRPQNALAEMFGIRAANTKKKTVKEAQLAKQETTTTLYGVEPDVLRALNTGKDISKSVDEVWEQWDSQHPINKQVGRFHLSGYGYTNIDCVAGEVIGMSAGGPGHPAIVVNDYGKGHTLYSALMLGTMFDAGPIRYEWDSAREGTSFARLLDAYLRYSGLEPFIKTDLPLPVQLKLRIENPLVDAKKNVVIGMINTNDLPIAAFPLTLRWPDSAPRPKLLLVSIGGNRQMQQVPFELKDGKLTLTMPGFDAYANILALTDSDPLISMEISGVPRQDVGMAMITPGSKVTIKATVWNPSPRKLPAGEVKFYTAPGWFCNQNTVKVDPIAPYASSKETIIEVVPPAICNKLTLRPFILKYQAGNVNSTPCTELVWWANKPTSVVNVK